MNFSTCPSLSGNNKRGRLHNFPFLLRQKKPKGDLGKTELPEILSWLDLKQTIRWLGKMSPNYGIFKDSY